MAFFSVPADFLTTTLDVYAEMNRKYAHKIEGTYGQLTQGFHSNSGRALHMLPTVDKFKLEQYIQHSRNNNMDFNYTLNATCLGNAEFRHSEALALYRFLDELYELGVRSITIAMPSLLELARAYYGKFDIRASTLCTIDTPNKARWFREQGIRRMVVDEMANRDFQALQSMAGISDQLELIVNSVCHNQCVYRHFHQNQAAHYSEIDDISTYYLHRCMLQRTRTPGDWMRLCWIRPEDIPYYTDIGIHHFKIQGRQAVLHGDIIRCVKSYLSEEWNGNLLDLLNCFYTQNSFPFYLDNKLADGFIQPFMSSHFQCIHDCESCGYCDTFAKRCMDIQTVAENNQLAQAYYSSYDEYRILLTDFQNQH